MKVGRRYKSYSGETGVTYRYFFESRRRVVRPEGQGPGIEMGPAGVVLEPGERPLRARLEFAFEEDVPDHPPRPGDRVKRQEADARELLTALVTVVTAE